MNPRLDQVNRIAWAWVAAFNAHDLEGLLSVYGDNPVPSSAIYVKHSGDQTSTLRG